MDETQAATNEAQQNGNTGQEQPVTPALFDEEEQSTPPEQQTQEQGQEAGGQPQQVATEALKAEDIKLPEGFEYECLCRNEK